MSGHSINNTTVPTHAASCYKQKTNSKTENASYARLILLRDVSSKTGQTAGDLITVLSDVAPVIQGLTDYLAGQRKKLEDEDRAYLDAIKSAQSSGDFSDLFADDMMSFGEEVVEESAEEVIDALQKRLGINLPKEKTIKTN